jgi:crotonobetainyl-CoA:carnitine CoA-transferase CaiB-like acyl-CoA transferase
VVKIFQDARVPCGIVNTVDQLLDDPQVKARDMILYADYPGLGKIPLPGIPVKLSSTPGDLHSLAPAIGEHNEEVYCGLLGMSTEKFRQLKAGEII